MKKRIILTLLFLLILPFKSESRSTGVSGTNLDFFRPPVDSFGFFQVNGPQTMKAGEFHFQITEGAAFQHLFEVGAVAGNFDLVHQVASTYFSSSVGLTDFASLGLDLPVHLYAREADVATSQGFTTSSLGDLRWTLKFRLLAEKKDSPRPGIALLITDDLPTGDESKFLGTSHMVPGFDLILGKTFKSFSIAMNVGGRFPQEKTILGINFDDQLTYGAGMKIPVKFIDPLLSFMGEIHGHTEPRHLGIVTSPIGFVLGLRKDFRNGLSANAGAGGAWNNAVGNPRVRGILSIGYSPALQRSLSPSSAPSAEAQKRDEILTTLYFRSGAISPTAESVKWLRDSMMALKKKIHIKIHGHTDSRGPHAYNQRLSLQRANRVKDLLLKEGWDASRIETQGLNGEHPIAPNQTTRGRRLNRRVDVLFF